MISSSPGDLEPVFATMLEKAVHICDANFGNIYRWDGDALHLVATIPCLAEARRRSQYRPDPKTVTGRMLETKAVVHIADLAAESAYIEERHPAFVAGVELGGVRTILAVPMLKEDKLIGSSRCTARKSAPLLVNRSRWSRTLPPKLSSPSRTHGC